MILIRSPEDGCLCWVPDELVPNVRELYDSIEFREEWIEDIERSALVPYNPDGTLACPDYPEPDKEDEYGYPTERTLS